MPPSYFAIAPSARDISVERSAKKIPKLLQIRQLPLLCPGGMGNGSRTSVLPVVVGNLPALPGSHVTYWPHSSHSNSASPFKSEIHPSPLSSDAVVLPLLRGPKFCLGGTGNLPVVAGNLPATPPPPGRPAAAAQPQFQNSTIIPIQNRYVLQSYSAGGEESPGKLPAADGE